MNAKKNKQQTPATRSYTPTIKNKKAGFNFHFLEKIEAGLALVGTEVKSLRQGKASLDEAFCRFRDDELYLIGCNIPPYTHGNIMNHDPTRPRKLLLHRRELKKLQDKVAQKGLTIVPVRIYFNRGLAKVEIALARGKTHADKRDKIKERDQQRDMKRAMDRYR